jgi:dTDP-4-amino-4,6-dideoxygalactose transaminase
MVYKGHIVKVPLQDLKVGYQSLRNELLKAVTEVMDSQQYILGPRVAQLEENIAAYCGVSHGIGASSGSDALLLAMLALGAGAGDEVITTPFTFFATAGSIVRVGARPVFVDIDPETFNLDPEKVESAISPKTKAILPVHLFGQIADMENITDVARRHNLFVVEDAAQAIGAKRDGKSAGSFGRVGCFSFYPTKNLGGAGDGGMVVTDDSDLASRLKQLRNHGEESRYQHRTVGINGRMDGLQAAVLLTKFRHLDDWNSRRIENAHYYTPRLENIDGITPPIEDGDCYHIYHQYVIRCKQRDQLRQFLTNREIGSGVYYPLPLHMQPCFSNLGYRVGDFPLAETAAQEVLALPIYPELKRDQQDVVIDAVAEFSRTVGRKGG